MATQLDLSSLAGSRGLFEAPGTIRRDGIVPNIGRAGGPFASYVSHPNRDDHPVQALPSSTRNDSTSFSHSAMLSRPTNNALPPTPPPPSHHPPTAKGQPLSTEIDIIRDRFRPSVPLQPLVISAPPPPPPPPPPLSLLSRRPGHQSPADAYWSRRSGSDTLVDLEAASPGTPANAHYNDSAHDLFEIGPRSLAGSPESPFSARVSTNGSSSDISDDIFETYNNQFPPLLPTVGGRSHLLSQRKFITNAIADKVVQTETRVRKGGGHLQVPHPDGHYAGSHPGSSAVSSHQDDDEVENEQIQVLWTDLKEKRKDIAQARVVMAQHRRRMQQHRHKKAKAEVAFMDFVRRKILFTRDSGTTPPDDKLLQQRYAEMERLSTEYQRMELNYEDLENHLDDEEGIANRIEVEFFSKIARQQMRPSTPPPVSEDEGLPKQSEYLKNTPYMLLGISRNGPTEEDHPFWMDLISAIEDMNMALEDLSELTMRHEALEYAKQLALEDQSELDMRQGAVEHAAQLRPMIGRPMAADDDDFMSKYPSLEASGKSKVDEAIQEVRRLHQKCKLHGVAKKFPSHALAYILDNSIGPDLSLDDQWPPGHSLAHAKFPKLLSAPDHVLRNQTALKDLMITTRWPPSHPDKAKRHAAAMKEYGIHQLVYDVGSKNDEAPQFADDPEFIPRWLLHQLRTSALEAHRLAAIFPQVTGLAIRNYDRWQADVLTYWWHDDTLGNRRKHAMLHDEESLVMEYHQRNRTSRPRTWDGSSSRREFRLRSSDAASLPTESPRDWIEANSGDSDSVHSA